MRRAYEPAGLVWTAPLGFDNTFALVIRGDDAARLGVRTISDAARHAGEWRAAFGYEFKERADGYPGLARTYGLAFKEIRIMDLGLLYRALAERQVDIVAGNATDGLIGHLKLAVLADDPPLVRPVRAATCEEAITKVHAQLTEPIRAVLRDGEVDDAKVDGDRAVVHVTGAGVDLQLRRIADEWKITDGLFKR